MQFKKNNTPKSLEYRMPAEWEPQEAVWLCWPHNKETWAKILPEVEETYAEFVKAIHNGQKIKILVNDEDAKIKAQAKLKKAAAGHP